MGTPGSGKALAAISGAAGRCGELTPMFVPDWQAEKTERRRLLEARREEKRRRREAKRAERKAAREEASKGAADTGKATA